MISVPKHEQRVTRVFALSMSNAQAKALSENPELQNKALGTASLAPSGIEVFRLADLGELGLIGYLREGLDLPENDLKRDRAKLAALEGWVMLVYSSAFEGHPRELSPIPELTLVGSYGEVKPEKANIDLNTDAAEPYSGSPDIAQAKAPHSGAKGSLGVVLLFVIVAIILWWALA